MANLALVLGRKIEGLHHRDGGADIAPALFRIERAVGGKDHVVDAEKIDAANRGSAAAGERGVAIKILEIVVRPLLEALEQRGVVLVRCARAELVPGMAHPPREIRNDAAEVMGDHLQAWAPVHDAGEDEPGARYAGLVGPADDAADLVF